ncbi:MAG TPA: tetratricopeptide repeat protein [Kiritimatiellia bacterium]|nr:tetratricopeptide repeat protein [Kiritimatiellia bacterium]HMP33108.1 tetratricopeptide repeat protein [Kiritimatiellia bacterium]
MSSSTDLPSAAPRPGLRAGTDLWLGLLLVLGTVAVYAPALGAGFIWDDDVHFTANEAVRRWRGIIDIWTSRTAVYYPLVLTTAWVVHKVAGFSAPVFHALTLGLHIANALLLVLLLRRLRIPGAWVAGFLFAWHPLQVESVAWVTELKNTQSGFFLLLSLLALQASGFFERAAFPDRRARGWHWASIALFALALLSKPSVVMAPAALLAVVWWRRGIRRWMDVDALFPVFMLALLASGWTVWEQRYSSGAHGFEWAQSPLERLALAGQVTVFYLRKLVWPEPLMFLYPPWPVEAGRFSAWLPLLGVLAAAALCVWKSAGWGRYPGLTLWWIGVFLFPVMGFFNVYFMRYAWVADHFVYLPIIGWCAALGAAWWWLAERQRALALALAVVVLAACGWASHRHARSFHDNETLWRASIAASPAAWMAHNNLGLIHAGRDEDDLAEHHYRAALEHNPRHYEALHNLGLMRLVASNASEALTYFDQALALRPDLYVAVLNRGRALEQLGDTAGALAAYDHAVALHPPLDTGYVAIGMLSERTGQPDRAIQAYERLLSRKNATPEQVGGFLFERAYQVGEQGDVETALILLAAARQRAPRLPDIHLLEGMLKERRGDWSGAEKSYRIAMSFRPDWGAVLVRLARLLAAHPDPAQRRPAEAVEMVEAMLAAGGRDIPEIVDAYAMALASSGRYGDAIRTQQRAIDLAPNTDEAAAMNQRLVLYTRGQSYTLPLPSPINH